MVLAMSSSTARSDDSMSTDEPYLEGAEGCPAQLALHWPGVGLAVQATRRRAVMLPSQMPLAEYCLRASFLKLRMRRKRRLFRF